MSLFFAEKQVTRKNQVERKNTLAGSLTNLYDSIIIDEKRINEKPGFANHHDHSRKVASFSRNARFEAGWRWFSSHSNPVHAQKQACLTQYTLAERLPQRGRKIRWQSGFELCGVLWLGRLNFLSVSDCCDHYLVVLRHRYLTVLARNPPPTYIGYVAGYMTGYVAGYVATNKDE